MEVKVNWDAIKESDIFNRPELITSYLYKKLLEKIDLSMDQLTKRNFAEVNRNLQYCRELVTRLGVGIKYEAGLVADQLEALYQYIADKLVEANIKKDERILAEVRHIVFELDGAWDTAMRNMQAMSSVDPAVGVNKSKQIAQQVKLNPYQRRELQHEVLHYDTEKTNIQLKK